MAEEKSTQPTGIIQPKVGRRIIDHAGKRFGKLTAVSFQGYRNGKGNALWLCQCDCGGTVITRSSRLVCGNTTSCGCFNARRTHGKSKSSEFKSWMAAKARCFNPKCAAYPDYGGRGITMCEEWRDDFEAFLNHVGPRPKGTSLDRIDNEGSYVPGNVRWATQRQQGRNTRSCTQITHNGLTLTMIEWAERTGIPYRTLKYRRCKGYPLF